MFYNNYCFLALFLSKMKLLCLCMIFLQRSNTNWIYGHGNRHMLHRLLYEGSQWQHHTNYICSNNGKMTLHYGPFPRLDTKIPWTAIWVRNLYCYVMYIKICMGANCDENSFVLIIIVWTNNTVYRNARHLKNVVSEIFCNVT